MNVEHGDTNGQASDGTFNAGRRLASGVEERDVGGGAPHIEGENRRYGGRARDAERTDDTSCRAGEDGADGLAGGGCSGEDSAGGLHDAECGVGPSQPALEGMNVALQLGREIGIEGDGGAALVLAEFREDLMRERDGQMEKREGGGNGLFVRGIREGEEERDGDGFGVGFANRPTEFLECSFSGSEEDGAVGVDAFGESEAEVGNGCGAVTVPVVEIGARLPCNGEGVLESGGGDEGDAGTFAFEQRVGGDGGAVANFDGGGRNERADAGDGFEDGAAGIAGRGGELEHFDATADAVDTVSEGAAGINGNGEAGGHCSTT